MAKAVYKCTNCCKDFERWPSQMRNGCRPYCSRGCRWDWSRNFGEFRGVNNPRYLHGNHCSPALCKCGGIKDYRADKCNSCKLNIEAWFQVDTSKRNASLWRYIKEYDLLPWSACSMCGQGWVWNGQPLSLHLDHINGMPTDNRLDNLRVLCPNCHTQTPTYASRNRRK